MSSRPKPRPRPRPRAPAATAAIDTNILPPSSPGPSSAAASTPPPPSSVPALSSIDEEDALFIRNQTRTAQAWKRINKLAEEKENKKRKASHSDSSDSERESGSSPRARGRKAKKRTGQKNTLPDWTRKRPQELIELSDSEDDDILAPKAKQDPTVERAESSSQSNGKRARSRSRSITPPPALSQYALERAQAAIREFVGAVYRPPSPTDLADESMDTVVLDKELASIAQRVKSQTSRLEGTPVPEGGGPETVNLKITWRPHPLDPQRRTEVWTMRQKRHENFHRLSAEIADIASIREENLVLSLDGKRVFPSSTPHSVDIWAEAELEACEKETFLYLQENKRMRSESVAPPEPLQLGLHSRRSPSQAAAITELSDSGDGAAASDSDDKDDSPSDVFQLVIRSERTKGKDITLRVRPTTKCGAIVRAFLKKAGLDSEYPENVPAAKGRGRKAVPAKVPALSVDGDRMAPEDEIGVADLEDGDQVEVVGL
ncbi:hypothetical protein GY45DRAFT_1302853 [Cubamyces sp. BRFM 1775]|nr:hypothetical protein GY45DRAFT_1302853 [Cubamyces sp. BRFM 1775]